ncbi:MAG: hypothetical protein IT286_04880 [Proteobacteria bacterium]|jgi:hypothetical protein|nr:hypothetical protein [Pseudomonadota bacterium]
MTNILLIIIFILIPHQAFAKITLENVSDALLQEFYSKKQKPKDVFNIEKKNTDDIRTESMTFFMGDQVYKLVIFGDGQITLSTGQKGDVALQELLNSTTEKTTPIQIIRLIQGFQKENPSARAYQKDDDFVDKEGEKVKTQSTADALRWGGLINRAMKGETMNISTSGDSGFSQSVSAAKMMNQCQGGGGAGGSAQAAVKNIAEALVMANFSKLKTSNEAKTDRSREFNKRGSYSFFDEVDQFTSASPERAYQLLQKTRTSEYEIFQTSLQKSNIESKDPYYLAANRNFMFLVRTIGKEKTLKLMDDGMKKIVINIERFVEYRKILPASSIVYDRNKDKFYIDPTLNQPSQARYLLSLVSMYEWKNQAKDFSKQLNDLEKASEKDKEKQVKDVFKSYREFLKNTSHPRF